MAFGVYFAAYKQMNLPPTGDQGHYALEAQSLLRDQDRDLRNDYADPARYGPIWGRPIDSHAHRYTSSPRQVSAHNVGLPILLVPAAAMSRKTDPMAIEIVILAAAAAFVLLSILRQLDLGRPLWTYLVWAAVAFSLPVVAFSSQIFPEVPGLLFSLLALRAAISRPLRRRTVILGAMAASFLPWLHVRFTFLAAALVGALAIRAATAPELQRGPRPSARWNRVRGVAERAALAVGPLVVSLVAMGAAFQAWYGSPWLDAPLKFGPHTSPSAAFAYHWLLGGMFSSDSGWVTLAPVALFGLAGLGYLCWRYPRWGTAGVFLVAGYLAIVNGAGFSPGWSFPWRYQLVVIPLIAIPLALVVANVRVLRLAVLPLIAVTVVFTVQGVDRAFALYREPANANAPPSVQVRFRPVWPNFAAPPGSTDRYPALAHLTALLFGLVVVGALAIPARDRRWA